MYPRLEEALRAAHNRGEATGVVRWTPPPGLYDENGNPNNTHAEQPEIGVGGNPYRLPASQGGYSDLGAMEGERQMNERMMDESLIDMIPMLQQQIQSLTQKVTELQEKVRGLELREDTLVKSLHDHGALPGYRSLSA